MALNRKVFFYFVHVVAYNFCCINATYNYISLSMVSFLLSALLFILTFVYGTIQCRQVREKSLF